jgi:hypothetical protein
MAGRAVQRNEREREERVHGTVNRVWISGDGLEWYLVFQRVNRAS